MGGLRLLAGLELGRSHFTLAVGHLADRPSGSGPSSRGTSGPGTSGPGSRLMNPPARSRLVVKAIESIPARGVERGVLSDPVECSDCVARLIRQVERSLPGKVNKVLAALPGNHVKSTNASASIPIPDPGAGISPRDVERALATCRTLGLTYDCQILHAFERGFAVDGQSGVKDPVGLYGTKLTAQLHLVFAQNLAVQSLLRVLNRAGLEVEELVLPAVAAAEAVLTDLDKDLGVTLIRIGELHSEALIFTEGAIRETFLFSWGTDRLIETLSRSFKVPFVFAEQLLPQIRSLEPPPEGSPDIVRVRSGNLTRTFPKNQAVPLVRSRTKEFLSRLLNRLEQSPLFRESAAGIVMVGTLPRLEGFLEMAEGLFNMPVRLGTVREIELDPSVSLSGHHTTVLGLLRHAAQKPFPRPSPWPLPRWLKWLDRPRRLLEEYF